jgi:hypothetical protein
LEDATTAFNAIYVFSDDYVIIGGQGGFLYYTINGGFRWTKVEYNGTVTFSINSAFASTNGLRTIFGLNTGEFIDTNAFADSNNILPIRINAALPPNNKYASGLSVVVNVDGYNDLV